MTDTFILRRQVEFNHCDPAGIVFYPRYFEMISAVTERFFADAVGFGWTAMRESGNGTPMGTIEARFHAPSRLEDWLDFVLTVKRIGRSSAVLLITGSCEGEPRFTCEATVIHANVDSGSSSPWPDALRAIMSRYLHPSSQIKKDCR